MQAESEVPHSDKPPIDDKVEISSKTLRTDKEDAELAGSPPPAGADAVAASESGSMSQAERTASDVDKEAKTGNPDGSAVVSRQPDHDENLPQHDSGLTVLQSEPSAAKGVKLMVGDMSFKERASSSSCPTVSEVDEEEVRLDPWSGNTFITFAQMEAALAEEHLSEAELKVRWASMRRDPQEVRWQWEHKTGWRDYTAKESQRIEKAYLRGDGYVRLKSGKTKAVPMEIFFVDMLQHDPISRSKRRVRRFGPKRCCNFGQRLLAEIGRSVETGKWQRVSYNAFHRNLDGNHNVLGRMHTDDFARKYREGTWCTWFVRSTWMYIFTNIIVAANVIWIGVYVQVNDEPNVLLSKAEFQVPEHLFGAFFVFEIMVRFLALRRRRECIDDLHFVLDAALVLLIVLEVWLLPLVFLDKTRNGDSTLGVMRTARLMRLTSLIRLLKFEGFITIIKGLWFAMSSVMWTMLLLVGLVYAFGVVFTALAKGNDKLKPWFGNIGLAMWTLLINGTFLDDVGEMLVPVRLNSPGLAAIFIVFTFISALAVLNLLVGVLCDVVSRTKQAEHKNAIAHFVRQRMYEILECHDTDDDGYIEKAEFKLLMENPEMHRILRSCNISEKIFADPLMLDGVLFSRHQGEDGEICSRALSYDQLVDIVLRLSGGAAATINDLNDLRDFVRERLAQIENMIRKRTSVTGSPGTISPEPSFLSDSSISVVVQGKSSSQQSLQPQKHSLGGAAEKAQAKPFTEMPPQRLGVNTSSTSSMEEQPAWARELMKQMYGMAERQKELQEEVRELRAQLKRQPLSPTADVTHPCSVP